jgi:hypothetical protein
MVSSEILAAEQAIWRNNHSDSFVTLDYHMLGSKSDRGLRRVAVSPVEEPNNREDSVNKKEKSPIPLKARQPVRSKSRQVVGPELAADSSTQDKPDSILYGIWKRIMTNPFGYSEGPKPPQVETPTKAVIEKPKVVYHSNPFSCAMLYPILARSNLILCLTPLTLRPLIDLPVLLLHSPSEGCPRS